MTHNRALPLESEADEWRFLVSLDASIHRATGCRLNEEECAWALVLAGERRKSAWEVR